MSCSSFWCTDHGKAANRSANWFICDIASVDRDRDGIWLGISSGAADWEITSRRFSFTPRNNGALVMAMALALSLEQGKGEGGGGTVDEEEEEFEFKQTLQEFAQCFAVHLFPPHTHTHSGSCPFFLIAIFCFCFLFSCCLLFIIPLQGVY